MSNISTSTNPYKTKTFKSTYIPYIKSKALTRYFDTDIFVTPESDIMIFVNMRYLALCNSLLKEDPLGVPYFIYRNQKVYPHVVVLRAFTNSYDNILKKVTYKDGLTFNYHIDNMLTEKGFPTSFAGQVLYLKIVEMMSNVKIVRELGTTISTVRSITERDRYNSDLSHPYTHLKRHYRYIAAYEFLQQLVNSHVSITLTADQLVKTIGGRKEFNGKNAIDVFRAVIELGKDVLNIDYINNQDSLTIFRKGYENHEPEKIILSKTA